MAELPTDLVTNPSSSSHLYAMKASSSMEADEFTIDVDALASSLHELMPQSLSVSEQCSIFKVPGILKRHNPEAYVPIAFSIGPWHHDREHLKIAEEIKLNYLKRLISASPSPKKKLKKLIQAIAKVEKDARACYAGPVEMSVEDFVKLLVIDGCFIIELFRKYWRREVRDEYDPIFDMSCMFPYLDHDLILLENQIPWFVLQLLFNKTMKLLHCPLEILAIHFFYNTFSWTPSPMMESYQGKKHILDLLREWLVLSSDKAMDAQQEWQPIPSVKNLEEAGIKFKKNESKCILDIKFENGVLEIPSILIEETTEDIFRNLISFEQCSSQCPAIITSYAVLLDNLINTEKDLNILCEEGIIVNWLNPEDATRFFNKLYHDANVKKYYYLEVCKQMNDYYLRCWPRWRAAYMHNFGTPWAIVSQVLAAIVVILTILQTVFAILK